MLDIRIGKVSSVGVHVIVNMVKNPCLEGFQQMDGFVISDINPENKQGQPKFLAEVEAVTHQVLASEGVDSCSWIDIEKLGNLNNLLDYLVGLKKGDNKIKVAIDFGDGHMSRTGLQQLVITSKYYADSITLIAFTKNIEDVNKVKEIINAVSGMITTKESLALESDAFGAMMKEMYKNNLLNSSTANIVERSYGVKPDLTGKKVILVDTHNFFYRSYHGMADLRTADGRPTGLIKGFMTFLKSIKSAKADYIVFLSEGHGSFRKTDYSLYKANREAPPEELIYQINVCNDMLAKMGMGVFKVDGFEADDGIGSFAKKFGETGADVFIYSTDKDLYQLITDNVKVYDTVKNIVIGPEEVFNHPKFGVYPNQMIDFQAIVGDTSDNVPGLSGQGPKAASTLLNAYGTLDGIYENIELLKGKQKETFVEKKDILMLSKKLVTLYRSLADDVNIQDYTFPTYDFFKLIQKDLESFEINL